MPILNPLKIKIYESIVRLATRLLADPRIKPLATVLLQESLKDPQIRRQLWIAANETPADCGNLLHGLHVRTYNLQKKMFDVANERTAAFILDNIIDARSFDSHSDLLAFCVGKALDNDRDGLFLEFGVFKGSTINKISSLVGGDIVVHGFDSFEGLPDNWTGGSGKGAFSTAGALPRVGSNVRLHRGWFEDTLPRFVEENPGRISFLHVDSDLYSSARTVFDYLGGRIGPGTVILFDEFFNYPGYEHHEYKAFFEFIESSGHKYEFIAYNANLFQAAVEIRDNNQTHPRAKGP